MLGLKKCMAAPSIRQFTSPTGRKPMLIKKFTLAKKTGMLALAPGGAKLQERDRFYLVNKSGYVGFEFTPVASTSDIGLRYDFDAKKIYFVNPGDIGTILRINAIKPAATDLELPLRSDVQKVLKIDLLEGGNAEFTYLEVRGENVELTHSIQVDAYEFTVIQKMLEFALPYIYGWQHLADYAIEGPEGDVKKGAYEAAKLTNI